MGNIQGESRASTATMMFIAEAWTPCADDPLEAARTLELHGQSTGLSCRWDPYRHRLWVHARLCGHTVASAYYDLTVNPQLAQHILSGG